MKETCLQNCMMQGVIEAGCDEAGRGPLAGPVFAAAVILPPDFHHPLLNDSKQMTNHEREILRPIIEAEAIAWAVEAVSAEEIDRINILNASIAGMQRAICRLVTVPEHLLIDGNRFRSFSDILRVCQSAPSGEIYPRCNADNNAKQQEDGENDINSRLREYDKIPFDCIVKGDGKFAAIAAASVLAKTHRDEYMRRIASDYPAYGWERNMGYPTKEHIEAIRQHGLTPHHRLSFSLKAIK